MCEELASIDCIDHCEDVFCSASIALTADERQADHYRLSLSGLYIGWVTIIVIIAGIIICRKFC
jgi:hypothetical protein